MKKQQKIEKLRKITLEICKISDNFKIQIQFKEKRQVKFEEENKTYLKFKSIKTT